MTFPTQLKKDILNNIDTKMKTASGPQYAAFDADGTLWDSDIGENFFQYLIDHGDLEALKNIDPWAHYEKLKSNHPPDAYLWLAQICSGHNYTQIKTWATEAVSKLKINVFTDQKELISEFQKRGIQTLIVSASVEWAVAAAAPLVGLNEKSAMGVKTRIVGNTITTDQEGPITWQKGKAQALLERTQGTLPLFCSGNSDGDIHLLELSQTRPLTIQTQNQTSNNSKLFKNEQILKEISTQKKWYRHSFID